MQTGTRTIQQMITFYSAATFRRLLDSSARPGTLGQLAYPDFFDPPPMHNDRPCNLYALGALLTLIDGETTFAVGDGAAWLDGSATVCQWLRLRSGSQAVAPGTAAFALLLGGNAAARVSDLNQGDVIAPEQSATIVWCVEALSPQEFDGATQLELRGVGIATTTNIYVASLTDTDVASIVATRQHYPLGLDVYLIDTAGRCLGLPRTTKISQH